MRLDASGALVGDEFVVLGNRCVWAKGPLGPKFKLLRFLRFLGGDSERVPNLMDLMSDTSLQR